ncbi:hypothetical protein N7468_000953 [Penicillium chermesinum]|uniref:Zn(2)-C6 fungal-type domain-containing protein n=1 Tax=Penicillium chermesinum TaxID=63820 RepID=A0A9W9PFU8_9EURO|nr:uncharacterized protein N7468_000953 [Penicillium chermesinum]KAJ5245970.1 hypothetical protein N7468_000953 [Penicillium chermesinum]
MGGAPGRSNGCDTCVRRKVKCDLQRPQCARCLRGGHRCGGYERTRKFIHTFAEPQQGFGGNSAQYRRESTLAVVNVNAQIRSQLFSLFVDSYVPSQPTGRVNWRCHRAANVLEDFPPLMGGENSQLLDRAVMALATGFVGRKFGDQRLTRQGIVLYNNSIQAFTKLISRSGLPVQEVLCANIAFQLYEVINCTYGFAGWMAHVQGANAVIAHNLRNLENNQLSSLMLREMKLSNIFHAIGKSRSALDSFPMWKSVSPADDQPMEQIIDILMECTGLVEDTSNIQSENDARRIVESGQRINKKIADWYESFETNALGRLYTRMSTRSDKRPNTRPIFPERYEFATVEVAESHMLYWAASLMIQTLLYEFERQREDSRDEYSHQASQSNVEAHRTSATFLGGAKFYAGQICHGVGYFPTTAYAYSGWA